MKNMYWDNLVKNLLVLFLLVIFYQPIRSSILNSSLITDKAGLGSLLVAVSILSVTACFGNFAFTYEKVELNEKRSQLLAHLTTGLLMLLIGLSLEMTSVLVGLLMGTFIIFDLSLCVLYVASICYDFWDLQRAVSNGGK